MAIYTKCFARGFRVGSGATVIYTVPVGKVVILRDVVLMHNDGGGSRQVGLYITSAGGALAWLRNNGALVANLTDHWDGRQAMVAGETITLQSTSTVTTFYNITGYQFDAV